MVKVIKVSLDGSHNIHIHQGLVKLHGNGLVFRMDLMFIATRLSHIMYGYTKLLGLWFLEQLIGTYLEYLGLVHLRNNSTVW